MKYNFKSLPRYSEYYYGGNTRYVGAVTSFIYSLPVVPLWIGMLGGCFGWPPVLGMFVLGGIGLIYTITGGFGLLL